MRVRGSKRRASTKLASLIDPGKGIVSYDGFGGILRLLLCSFLSASATVLQNGPRAPSSRRDSFGGSLFNYLGMPIFLYNDTEALLPSKDILASNLS